MEVLAESWTEVFRFITWIFWASVTSGCKVQIVLKRDKRIQFSAHGKPKKVESFEKKLLKISDKYYARKISR